MSTALWSASWLAVRRVPVLVPAAAAVALVAGTVPWQDDGYAGSVLHGVALLLACALAGTLDDPAAEVVAAAPVPRRRRTTHRMLLGLAVAAPLYLAAATVAEVRLGTTPLAPHVVEAVGFGVAAVALAAGLHAWRGLHAPAYPAGVGLVLLTLVAFALPRGWTMVDPQPWGPPLDAALVRWAGLTLVAVGVLLLALRDPGGR